MKENRPKKPQEKVLNSPEDYQVLPVVDDDGLEDIGQGAVDAFDFPATVAIGAGLVVSFNKIDNQEECEGIAWSFDVSGHLVHHNTRVANWVVDQIAPTGAPDLKNLTIGATGTITATLPGKVGDQTTDRALADEIIKDETYQIAVGAVLASGLGMVGKRFLLKVKAAPHWVSDPRQVHVNVTESKTQIPTVNFNSDVQNVVTSWDITVPARVSAARKAVPNADLTNVNIVEDLNAWSQAPSITLSINAQGVLVFSPLPVPNVNFEFEYTFTAKAENDCGWDLKVNTLRISELPPILPAAWTSALFNRTQQGERDKMPDEESRSDSNLPPRDYIGKQRGGRSQHGGGQFQKDPEAADCYFLKKKDGRTDVSIFDTDPSTFMPTFSTSISTGRCDLTSIPLVLGPRVRAFVQPTILGFNTAGAVSRRIQFHIYAVEPRWDPRFPIIIMVDEFQTTSYTMDKTTQFANWDFCHSASDPTNFTLINAPKWARIDGTSGNITVTDAPAVPGPKTPGAPGYMASQTHTFTARARNFIGSDDKQVTVVVANTQGEDVPGAGGTDDLFNEIDESGLGIVPDYELFEGDTFNYNVKQHMNVEWFRHRDNNLIPYYFFFREIRLEYPPVAGHDVQTLVIEQAPTPSRPTPMQPPDRLRITETGGTVIGAGDLAQAPDVDDRHYRYRIVFEVRERLRVQPASGSQVGRFFLTIKQKAPTVEEFTPDDIAEGSDINVNIKDDYENDPQEFDIGQGEAVRVPIPGDPDPPPAPLLDINNDGDVTSRNDEQAPDISQPEQYRYPVTARNTINYPTKALRDENQQEDTSDLILTFVEVIPEIKDIADQEMNEGTTEVWSLINFVENDPDSFGLISVVKTNSTAPDLDVSIDRTTGNMTVIADLVDQDEPYTITFDAENTAGVADPNGTMVITVKNLKPEWTGSDTFQMNEGTTKVFSVPDFINEDTNVDSFSVGTPTLQAASVAAFANLATPTLTASILGNAENGNIQCVASNLEGSADAYWTLPVTAENTAGRTPQSFVVQVLNVTTAPTCHVENQGFNENVTRTFPVTATSTGTIVYTKTSGASWITINRTTGIVTVNTPPVNGTLAANPYDDYNATFRTTVGTEFEECFARIRVFNTTAPPPDTPANWKEDIPDRAYVERFRFSFNIARHAEGEPSPTFGERTDAGTPEWARISIDGQVSGVGPSVGNATTVATLNGRVWRMVVSEDRPSVTTPQVSFSSGTLPSGVTLLHTVKNPNNDTTYYLVFSAAVDDLQRGDITIAGSPSVTVTNLDQEWWTTYTIYATATNTTNGNLNIANKTFNMLFINTDSILGTPPTLNVPNQVVDEYDVDGNRVRFRLDLKDYTTGTAPFTYERTLDDDGVNRRPLPDWTPTGTGLSLTTDGILEGDVPLVSGDSVETVYVTARNRVGIDPDDFTIRIQDIIQPEHDPPNWNIGNKRALENTIITIDPIRDGELTGSGPLTVIFTPNAVNPSFLRRLAGNSAQGTNDRFSGRIPEITDGQDDVYTVRLTARNVDDNGMTHSRSVTFTITGTESGEPIWSLSNKTAPELTGVTIDPISSGELTGDPTPRIDFTQGTTNASWLARTPAVPGTSNDIFTGTTQEVTGTLATDTIVDTFHLTATNTTADGTNHSVDATFTFTTTNVLPPTVTHVPPAWNMKNISVAGGAGVTIDPISTGELEGTGPITIDVLAVSSANPIVQPDPSDGITQTTNLARWLIKINRVEGTNNDFFTGTAPDDLIQETVYTVRLNATNTDADGTSHSSSVTFTITVAATTEPPPDPDCEPVRFRARDIPNDNSDDRVIYGRYRIPLGQAEDSDTFNTGERDFSQYVLGTNPHIYNNPLTTVPSWVTNPTNFGNGVIRFRISNRRSVWEKLLDGKTSVIVPIWLEGNNACTERDSDGNLPQARIDIELYQATFHYPVIGAERGFGCELPAVSVPEGGRYNLSTNTNANLAQYLTSTHNTDTPTWSKEGGRSSETHPWQNEDWWTITSDGTLDINPPSNLVQRTTTHNLYVVAENSDGDDWDCFPLTVEYIPDPPSCKFNDGRHMVEVAAGEIIRIDLATQVDNNVTDWRLDTITKVTVGALDLFLKVDNNNPVDFGIAYGSDNASDSGAVGTTTLAPQGDDPNVFTNTGAPAVMAQTDYEVTFTAIDTNLITTPAYPSNSAQCSFILRVQPTREPAPPPGWVDIPLQTTISGESISMSLAQYARPAGRISRYELVSTVHSAGVNPGPINMEISSNGVVTRQGGAVAPNVVSYALYNITVRCFNADAVSAETTYKWQIIPRDTGVEGAPTFMINGYSSPGYEINEYDPTTGKTVQPTAGFTSLVSRISSSNKGDLYIEAIGNTLWGMFGTAKELGRITLTGVLTNHNYAEITIDGSISGIPGSTAKGLTSIATLLYTFGSVGSGETKLFSIDTSTRVATVVNSAAGATNLGITGLTSLSGLTAVGTTLYAIASTSTGNGQWVSIPTSGSNRGIATVIDANMENQFTGTFASNNPAIGIETFGNNVQALIARQGSGSAAGNRRQAYTIVPSTGAMTRVDTTQRSGNNDWVSFSRFNIPKPVIRRIPTQIIQEGEVINMLLGSYVTGASSYQLGTLTAVTEGAPLFPLEVSPGGVVRGTSGSLTAPSVDVNSSYTVRFIALNAAGFTFQDVSIEVVNGPPDWDTVPPFFVREGQRIYIPLAPYVRNNPTTFTVTNPITVATGKPRAEAPNLSLQIDQHGNLYGVGQTINAPEVSQNERYNISVGAENTAGIRSTTVSLTIEDTGLATDRVPYVQRWDTPEEAQGGAFEILVDFNMPVYGLCPGSFTFEGIELRGTPFLTWSPVPIRDIPSNRPNAAARNLDYLTNPVPTRGTKYFKLTFPREILPETITRDQLMNIYLTSHSARGGVTV